MLSSNPIQTQRCWPVLILANENHPGIRNTVRVCPRQTLAFSGTVRIVSQPFSRIWKCIHRLHRFVNLLLVAQSGWSVLTWCTPSRRKVIELIPNPLWNLVLPYKAFKWGLISISSSIRALSHCAIRVKRYGSPFRCIWMLVSIISRRLSLCTKASFATAIAATTAIAEVTCATILVAAPAAIAAAAAHLWPSGRLIGRFMLPAFLVWFSADFRSSSSQSCLRPWQHVSKRSLSQIFGFSKTVLSFSSNTELGRKTNCKLCCADWRWWLEGPSQRVV